MEFSRIGENTIRCVITEEEINNLGYSIDEILGNAEKTQEFMNRIFDLAEEQFHMKFDMGLKTVRADFLPNHTVSLTFTENAAQQKVNGFMEQLLSYVNEMLGLSKDKVTELKDLAAKETDAEESAPKIIVCFYFNSMNVLCRFAKNMDVENLPVNALYKYKDQYYLMMDLSQNTEEEVLRLSVLTDEYATGLFVGNERYAFLKEHGELILKEGAIESLRQL